MNLKRGFPLSKKAMEHELFFTIFDIILAFVVFIALLSFVDGIKTKSTFERNFLARDTALLINTMYAAPGTFTIYYFEPLQGPTKIPLLFDFSSNKVSIKDSATGQSASYPYAENKNAPLTFNAPPSGSTTLNTITFEKTTQGLSITQIYADYEPKKS